VYVTGGTKATIYSDNLGTSLSNPFPASALGYWGFYADNGRYDVQISGSSIPSGSFTYGDVDLYDPSGAPNTAAGPSGSIQFNCSGVLCGSSNLTWDNVNRMVSISGAVGTPSLSVAGGWIQSAGGFLSTANNGAAFTSATDGAILRGYVTEPNVANTAGGYFDFAPLMPYAGSSSCKDQWGNVVTQPLPLSPESSFGVHHALLWVTTSSVMPSASTPNCPSPQTALPVDEDYGLSTNSYFSASGGLATDNASYNSIQSLLGGAYAMASFTTFGPVMLGANPTPDTYITCSNPFASTPSSCPYDSDGLFKPITWGGLAYDSGSVYWYLNGTTGTWSTFDFSSGGGGGGGANTALSNLTTTYINSALLFQTGTDIGSAAAPARNLYLFGDGPYGSTSFELTGTPTSNRRLALPDRSTSLAGYVTSPWVNGDCVSIGSAGDLVDAGGACTTGGGGGTVSSATAGQLAYYAANGTTVSGANLAGTSNEVSVTFGAGTFTLATPQAIATTSNVTFGNVTSSGVVQSSATGSSVAFQTTGGTAFQVYGNGAIATRNGLYLANAAATAYSALVPSPSLVSDVTWSLPISDSAGCWQSNGSGSLSISPCASGTQTSIVMSPPNPTLLSNFQNNAFQSGAYTTIQGKHLYATYDTGQFAIFDISTPSGLAAPVGYLSCPYSYSAGCNGVSLYYVEGVAVVGTHAFLAVMGDFISGAGSFVVVDCSDPSKPNIVASIASSTALDQPENVTISGNIAYVTGYNQDSGSSQFTAIDISDYLHPVVVGTLSNSGMYLAAYTSIQGTTAFVTCRQNNVGGGGLFAVDITNPAAMTVLGSYTTSTNGNMAFATGVEARGNYAYVAGTQDGFLLVLNVSNPASISLVGSVTAPQISKISNVNLAGNLVYTTSYGTCIAGGSRSYLSAFDITDPTTPTLASSTAAPSIGSSYACFDHLDISGRNGFVLEDTLGSGGGGLYAFDIGGITTGGLNAGRIASDDIDVNRDVRINGDLFVGGGINAARQLIDWTAPSGGLSIANKPFVDVRQYNWPPQVNTGSIAVGTNTIAMHPCPPGLPVSPYTFANGNYFVYLSGGVGTPEAVMVTASTCTSGGSGTITFSARFTHSGSWAVGPASFGFQEAIWVASANPTQTLLIPAGYQLLEAPVFYPRVYVGGPALHVVGEGETNTIVTPDVDVASPTTSIFFANNCGTGFQSCMGLQTSAENSSTAIGVTGAANNGAGLIRLTVASNPYQSEDIVEVAGVGGVPNATGVWRVAGATLGANTIDLEGSTWAGSYTTGGTVTQKLKAIFLVDTGDKAPLFENFTIGFSQPLAPSTIADILEYPTAIYARGTFGLDTDHLMISKSWVGLDLGGVWNGSTWAPSGGRHRVQNLDISGYRYAINVDGALDTTRIDNMHSWPFYAMTAQQQSVFNNDPTRRAIWAGRIDGVHITDSSFIAAGIDFHCGKGGGSTFGSLSGADFDGIISAPGLRMTCGNISHTGGYFTVGSGCLPTPLLEIDGGSYTSDSIPMTDYGCGLGNLALFQGGVSSFSGSTLSRTSITNTTVPADILVNSLSLGGGQYSAPQAQIVNNSFYRDCTVAWANAFIDVEGTYTRASVLGNRGGGKCTGGGYFVKVGMDDWHRVLGNVAPGYLFLFPTPGSGVYQDQVLTYTQLSGYWPSPGIQPLIMSCSDCNATCTAGSSSGQMCFFVNGAWTH